MPVRISKSLVAFIVVLICMGGVAVLGLWNWSLSSKFGRVTIPLRNGGVVYAVRESWGLGSEQLSITRNPDGCVPADPAKDYVFRNPADATLLYAVTGDGLTIFDYPFNRIVEEPSKPWNDVKVTLSRSKEPFYDDVHANPSQYGAVRTQIPLNETCWINVFRRSNSFRK